DLSAALFAVYAILAALFAREQSRIVGETIEVPMFDTMLSLLTYTATLCLNTGKLPRRVGSEHEYVVPWQAIAASDGNLVVAVRSDKFWARLCTVLNREDL